MYRQGDVLIVPITEAEYQEAASETTEGYDGVLVQKLRRAYRRDRPGWRPKANPGLILVPGEATGHHHKVTHPKAKLEIKDGEMFLTVPSGGVAVTHEEHDAVTLPAGKYKVVRQKEYEPPTRRSSGGRSSGSRRNVYD